MSPGTLESHVEQAAVDLFASMGWETANVYHEAIGAHGTLGRETKEDVVLLRRLRPALEKLNPGRPADAIDEAIRRSRATARRWGSRRRTGTSIGC